MPVLNKNVCSWRWMFQQQKVQLSWYFFPSAAVASAGVFPPNTLDLQCRKTRPWRFKCEPLTLPDTWHQKTSQTQSCKKWQIYLPDLCYYSELVLNFELHTYTHVIRGKYYSFFLLFTGFIGKFMLFCRKLDYDIIYAFLVLNLGTTLHLWSTDNWHYS